MGNGKLYEFFGEPREIDARLPVYERPCLLHELGISKSYLNLDLESRYQKLRIGPDLYATVRHDLAKAGLLDRAGCIFAIPSPGNVCFRKTPSKRRGSANVSPAMTFWASTTPTGIARATQLACSTSSTSSSPAVQPTWFARSTTKASCWSAKSENATWRQASRFAGIFPCPGLATERCTTPALRWSLTTADGTALAKGEQAVAPIESGALRRIAAIDAATPKLDQPKKVVLNVELAYAGRRLHNHWNYWIFPCVEPVVPENVLATTSLDAAAIKKLVDGGRVVLLGSKPFPARPTSFQIERPINGQSSWTSVDIKGNLATVIAKHPLTDQFPHDGYCDWQFSKMLTNGEAVRLDAVPAAFDPIVEVVSSYKTISKQAAVFEWRVGKGRLLVCSLNLSDSDPAAVWFRHCLLAYAGSDQFQPRGQVAEEKLVQLLKQVPAVIRSSGNGDQGFDQRGQLPSGRKNP